MKFSGIIVAALLAGVAGCDRSDGERLARVGRKVADNGQALIPERTPLGRPIAITQDGVIAERVRQRMRSDRYLSALPIEVAAEGATVRLKGQVDDPALKRRSLEIAESTLGVDKVIDELAGAGAK